MTQVDTASNNYIRPSTKAQVRNALGKMNDSDKIDGHHLTVGTTAPSSPATNDIWLDTSG
jgi:hypothetical protein